MKEFFVVFALAAAQNGNRPMRHAQPYPFYAASYRPQQQNEGFAAESASTNFIQIATNAGSYQTPAVDHVAQGGSQSHQAMPESSNIFENQQTPASDIRMKGAPPAGTKNDGERNVAPQMQGAHSNDAKNQEWPNTNNAAAQVQPPHGRIVLEEAFEKQANSQYRPYDGPTPTALDHYSYFSWDNAGGTAFSSSYESIAESTFPGYDSHSTEYSIGHSTTSVPSNGASLSGHSSYTEKSLRPSGHHRHHSTVSSVLPSATLSISSESAGTAHPEFPWDTTSSSGYASTSKAVENTAHPNFPWDSPSSITSSLATGQTHGHNTSAFPWDSFSTASKSITTSPEFPWDSSFSSSSITQTSPFPWDATAASPSYRILIHENALDASEETSSSFHWVFPWETSSSGVPSALAVSSSSASPTPSAVSSIKLTSSIQPAPGMTVTTSSEPTNVLPQTSVVYETSVEYSTQSSEMVSSISSASSAEIETYTSGAPSITSLTYPAITSDSTDTDTATSVTSFDDSETATSSDTFSFTPLTSSHHHHWWQFGHHGLVYSAPTSIA